jgi:GntR family transcriptional regulator
MTVHYRRAAHDVEQAHDVEDEMAAQRSGAGPRVLARGEGSLWVQLLADLRRRLAGGAFTRHFPGELELVAEYQVSRHTVREALRVLRDEGVVVAGRGRPPRLADPVEITQRLGSIYSLFDSVRAAGMTQRSVVRTLDVRADGVVASHLDLEGSTPLVYLERLRLAGPDPLAIDRVWLPELVAAPLLDVDFSHTALYTEFARLCDMPMTGGQEQIRAVVPTPAERELLGITPEVAVFSIERLGCSRGRPVEWRHTLVRGDRYAVASDLVAPAGYHLGLSATR